MRLAYEIQKQKIKWIIYGVGGFFLFIIFIISALVGALNENDCDTDTANTVSSSATSKSQKENAKQIYDYLIKNYDATPQGASGVLGNLQQESQLDPSSIERPNDPLSGHGIVQWTAGRTTNLMNFAKDKGKKWDNLGLQLEFLDSELKGSEKNGLKALKETDVRKATTQWQVLFERAGDPVLGNRLSFADHWYAEFGTKDPVSSDTLGNASDQENATINLECASDDDDTGKTDGNIIKTAKSMKGYFRYGQQHPSPDLGNNLKKPNKTGTTDCSGYIWLVLNKAGYKVPKNMAWFTGSMSADAKGAHKWLKQIKPSDAKAGDIVIVNQGAGAGNNGHTAFLTENWHGKDTKIIQEGGDTTGHVNEGRFGTSFSILLDGGDVVLARPVKK